MRFFKFFHAYMVQKYQNESAPIFYYGKSPKTNKKHLKIPYLQALTLGHVIKMTLYLKLNFPFLELDTGPLLMHGKYSPRNNKHISYFYTSQNCF